MSCLRSSVLVCLVLVTGGALNAEPLRVEIIDPPEPVTVLVNEPVPFEAIAYTSDGTGFISDPEWTWEFGDGDTSAKNPTEHAYVKEGSYTVIVTATAVEGTGSAKTTVEVIGDGGGGDQLLGSSLYLRDPITKAAIGADGVCDVVEVVFETTDIVCSGPTLYKQSPPQVPGNEWTSMGTGTSENTGNPNLRRWYWSWMTWSEKNWAVNFKVIYARPKPPPQPPEQVTFGPVTWTPNNTVVHSGDEILPWNGTDPLTIAWTITHANRNNPRFTVTVSIYVIDSTSPTKTITLTDQGLGAGSVPWSGQTTQGPSAQPGIYTYQVSAFHTAWFYCQNGDKSGQLLPSVEDYRYWLLPTAVPSVRTMTGYVQYKLNRAAGAAHIDIYGGDLAGGYPVLRQGNIACPDLSAGIHLASAFSFDVSVDANGELLGTYHAVIHSTETAADGQLNRDLLPKFAMQRNDVDDPVTIDLAVAGRDEGTEESPGGYLCVNLGDDDADTQEDRTQATPPAPDGIAGEDDLLGLTLGLPDAAVNVGTLTLTATAGGANIGDRVWLSAIKAPVGGVHSWALGGPQTTWDLSVPQRPSQTGLFLEGIAHSGAPRDITLEFSYTVPVPGVAPRVDRVNLTVFEVTTLTPDNPGSVKVMTSTAHDNMYYIANQTEDGKVRIDADIQPALADVPICFRSYDPDDLSQYEPDVLGNDNRLAAEKFGRLAVPAGFVLVPGSEVQDGGHTVRLAVWSVMQPGGEARASAELQFPTDHYGENYIVRGNPCSGPDGGDRPTTTMVSWKRVYLEIDQMYTEGANLTVDVAPDGDHNPDIVTVDNAGIFSVGDMVIVFDALDPNGEQIRVDSVNAGANQLGLGSRDALGNPLADLVGSYNAGYGAGDQGAAIVEVGTGTFSANTTPDGLEPPYGAAPDGTDGGCLVEYQAPAEGAHPVPFYEVLRWNPNDLTLYSNVWFAHRLARDDYIHVVAARAVDWNGANVLGLSWDAENWCYLGIQRLTNDYGAAAPQATLDVVGHELGHQFGLNDDVRNAHDNAEECLMNLDRTRTDAHMEFCLDDLWNIRDHGGTL